MAQRSTEMTATTDLLGKPLADYEAETLRVYEALKALAARDDLPPCAARNVRKALAAMWQVTNDLDLQFEQLYHLGVGGRQHRSMSPRGVRFPCGRIWTATLPVRTSRYGPNAAPAGLLSARGRPWPMREQVLSL